MYKRQDRSSTDKPVIKIATQKKNIQGKVTEYDYDKLQTGEEVTVTTVGSGDVYKRQS